MRILKTIRTEWAEKDKKCVETLLRLLLAVATVSTLVVSVDTYLMAKIIYHW